MGNLPVMLGHHFCMVHLRTETCDSIEVIHLQALFFLLPILQIRQNDRLAVSKLVTSLTRGTVRSPLAQCVLIRYTSQVYFFPGA